jgi:hydroxyethylthiazole kinase-like uncharacterized protein yjeF
MKNPYCEVPTTAVRAFDVLLAEEHLMARGMTKNVLRFHQAKLAADFIHGRLVSLHEEVGCQVWVLCGPNRTGEIGLLVANHLERLGHHVRVYVWPGGILETGLRQWPWNESALKLNAIDEALKEIDSDRFISPDLCVDALFGVDDNQRMPEEIERLAGLLDSMRLEIHSIEMPSGIYVDSGRLLGKEAFYADYTLCFSHPMPGHWLYPGRAAVGHLIVLKFDLLADAIRCHQDSALIRANHPEHWLEFIPERVWQRHKFHFGHLGLFVGPMVGASRLAALAAQRSGAGMVSFICLKAQQPSLDAGVMSQMVSSFKDFEGLYRWIDVAPLTTACLGPGWPIGPSVLEVLDHLLARPVPIGLVLDASLLSSVGQLSSDEQILFYESIKKAVHRGFQVVLTPHEEEFRRCFPGLEDHQHSKIYRAVVAARLTGACVVLKGADTVVADSSGLCTVSASPVSHWLATAGTGDVLSGLVGGFLAQGLNAEKAANAAVWVHGATSNRARHFYVAEDLIPRVSDVMSDLIDRCNGEG